MKVGYIRVSTDEQRTYRQEDIVAELGVDKVYIEKQSGKSAERPVLKEMLSFLREGDTLVVTSIDRFARNVKDLLNLVDTLSKKGVKFVSLKENIDTNTSTGKFMLTVFGAIAELEWNYIKERQREGIEAAKKRGVYKGRKKIEPDKKLFEMIYKQWAEGRITAIAAMKTLGLKRNTFYRRVKEFRESKGTCLLR